VNLKEALEARLAEAQGRVRGLEEALKVLKELNIGLSTLTPVPPPQAERPNSVPPPNIPADMLVAQQQVMQPLGAPQQQSGHMPPYLAAKARRIQEGKK